MTEIERYLEQEPTLTRAVVCYFVEGDRVLLGLRKKVSFGLGENLIAGIGGKLEEGEADEEALKREVKEEIGVEILEYKLMGRVKFLFPNKPKWDQEVAVFIVEKWRGAPTETEAIKPMWFNKEKLPKDQMWEDNAYFVPKILDGETIKATFLYDERGRVVEYVLDR